MKKLIAMLLALVMLLALCACGQTAAPAEQSTAAPAENPTAEPVEEPTDDVGEPVNLIFSIAAVPTRRPPALLRRSSRRPSSPSPAAT